VKALNDRRLAEAARLERQIKEIYSKVTGLEDAYRELEEMQTFNNPTAERMRRVQSRLASLEAEALRVDPGLSEYRRKVKELRRQVDEFNLLGLREPGKLLQYDRSHPPMALLKIASAARDGFLEDSRTALCLMRRAITSFLGAKGETVAYPS